jgi:hypothetical protein
MDKLQQCSQKIAGHIKKPMSIDDIIDQINSNEYNAELMLQHLLLFSAANIKHEIHNSRLR